jgi:hypothetical protein
MRAGDLKTMLATVPDDAFIVVESQPDHSFREASFEYTTVVLEEVWISPIGMRYKNIREYWEQKPKDLDATDKLVQAVIIS